MAITARYFIILVVFFQSTALIAHPMPNSLVQIAIKSDRLGMKIATPMPDFELAFGQHLADFNNSTALNEALATYFQQHIHINDAQKQVWKPKFISHSVQETTDVLVGKYTEVNVNLEFTPNATTDMRHFTLVYDAILHKIQTHKALINIVQDWDNGIQDQDQLLGVIEWDISTNQIFPMHVSLENGSYWKGFKRMFALGMSHIAEGTDHLLFVLVLLLPAPLLASRQKWTTFGGTRYTLTRLFKIITAFTIGHSLTLLLGTFGWVRLPSQPVEILIAFSILISALHAAKPLFYGREIWIAGGFGLIHGLAFASIVGKFDLEPARLLLSILGFNLGIEWMQCLVVLLFVPSFLMLSQFSSYVWVRLGGAIFTFVAAAAWIVERVSGKSNQMTVLIEKMSHFALPFALFLLVWAILLHFYHRRMIRH
jgi:HupE / UreJ protein